MPPRGSTPRVSIYHRTTRGTWSVRWRTLDGRQREETGYPSEAEAHERAVIIRRELQLRNPRARHGTVRIGHVITRYLEAGLPGLQPGTRDLYVWAARSVMGDGEFVARDAAALSTRDVNQWTAGMHVPDGSLRAILSVLSAAYRHAIDEGVLDANPVREARRPKSKRKLPVIPPMEDVLRLAIAAPSVEWRAMLLVAAFVGLRQGELFVLRWQHVGEDSIRVVEAASGSRRELTDPKTERGVRVVPMPWWVADQLAEWRSVSRGRASALVWPTSTGRVYSASSFAKKVWKEWREDAEVVVQWRHLRHFYASTLAASNASLLQCSRWMGHGQFSLTMDRYAFLFDADTPGVMDAMERRVESAM